MNPCRSDEFIHVKYIQLIIVQSAAVYKQDLYSSKIIRYYIIHMNCMQHRWRCARKAHEVLTLLSVCVLCN